MMSPVFAVASLSFCIFRHKTPFPCSFLTIDKHFSNVKMIMRNCHLLSAQTNQALLPASFAFKR